MRGAVGSSQQRSSVFHAGRKMPRGRHPVVAFVNLERTGPSSAKGGGRSGWSVKLMNRSRAQMKICLNVKPAVYAAAAIPDCSPMMRAAKEMMSRVIGFMKENVSQDSPSPTFFPSGELTTDLKWNGLTQAWTSSQIPRFFYPHDQLKEDFMLA